jgi:ankyrin repeat protein
MHRSDPRARANGKVYIDASPPDSEHEYLQHTLGDSVDTERLPPNVQGLLSTLKIPFGNQFGRESDVDPTLGLLNHVIECVAALRDTVKVYRRKEAGDFSGVVGGKIVTALTGEIGKMLIFSLTNDWEGQETAAGHFHAISGKILNTFPEIATRQHKVSGKMLLHHTCHKSSSRHTTEYVNSLLTIVPISASCQDAHGAVPLHWAMRNRNASVDMIKSLVQAYPNGPKVKDKKGFLPLHWAVHQEQPRYEIVEALLRIYPAGAREPCDSGALPLHWSVNQDLVCLPVVKLLVRVFPDALNTPCSSGWLPVHRAIDRADPDLAVVKYLVEQWPRSLQRPCNDGQLALHKIIDRPSVSVDMFNFIVDSFPNACQVADRDGYLPIHTALDCAAPSVVVVSRLLHEFPAGARRATLDELLPLHLAVTTPLAPQVEIVKLLIFLYPLAAQQVAVDSVPEDDNVNPNTWQGGWIEKKWTPLSRAIDRRLHDVVSILKSALTNKHTGGSSVNSKSHAGSRSRQHRRGHENSSRDSRSSLDSPNYYDNESESGASHGNRSEGPPAIGAQRTMRAQDFEISDDSELDSRASRGSRNANSRAGKSKASNGSGQKIGGGTKFRINIPKDAAKVRTSPLYGDRTPKSVEQYTDLPSEFEKDVESESPAHNSPTARMVSSAGSQRLRRAPSEDENPYLVSQAAVSASGGSTAKSLSIVTLPTNSTDRDESSSPLPRQKILSYDSEGEENASQSTHVRVLAPKSAIHAKFQIRSHHAPAVRGDGRQEEVRAVIEKPAEGRSLNSARLDDVLTAAETLMNRPDKFMIDVGVLRRNSLSPRPRFIEGQDIEELA